MMYCFNWGKFSSVAAHGNVGGADGGNVLLGQVQGLSDLLGTPELEQRDREGMSVVPVVLATMPVLSAELGGHEPTAGKSGGMVCS